jgi:5-methylcytosine-specific restriction endonuclease McrA
MTMTGSKAHSGWLTFAAYLNSEHWHDVSRIVRQRDQTCQSCFQFPSEEAHHLSYDTFNKSGFSFPQECVGVCRECHSNRVHRMVRGETQ